MIDVNKLSEGIDYELIPAAQTNEQAWWIRALTGPFIETVISFGNLSIDGENESINFNFTIVESPDPDLTTDNEALQQYCGMILHDVIEMGITRDEVQITEQK
jgi:hypothetical protein